MTPRLRQAQGAQGGDDDLNGEDHPFVHRATTAAAAPTGANEPTMGNTGIGPMGGEAGGQTRLDLQEEFAEDTAPLGYDEVNEIARHLSLLRAAELGRKRVKRPAVSVTSR